MPSSVAPLPGNTQSSSAAADDADSKHRLKDLDDAAKKKSQEVSDLEARIAQLTLRASDAELKLREKEERLAAQQRQLAAKSAEIEKEQEALERQKHSLRQAIDEFEASKLVSADPTHRSSSTVPEDESRSKDRLEGVPLTITFKNVELGPMIGSGSFAEVFKGSVRTPCAVKRLKSNFGREGMQVRARQLEP